MPISIAGLTSSPLTPRLPSAGSAPAPAEGADFGSALKDAVSALGQLGAKADASSLALAKGQPIVAVVQLGRFPGFALGIVTSKTAAYRDPQDLKGMKIGVTAPGSSTHFMAAYMMVRNGLKPDDASFIGVSPFFI